MLKNIRRYTSLAIATSVLCSSVFAAESTAVVTQNNCGKVSGTKQSFILVLNPNEDILDGIAKCAKDAKLTGASFSGLGQVHNPVLAYFSSNPAAKPTLTTLPGYFELATITGNISTNENGYYPHAHAVLADKQFHGLAGHLKGGKVGITVEITIKPLLGSAVREVDPKTGFGPLVS